MKLVKMLPMCMLALGLLVIATPSQAVETTDTPLLSDVTGPYYAHSENELRARKLFRGVANVGLAVFEIPNQAFQEAYKTSPVTGAVVGMFKGAWYGVKRACIGSWEILTFYVPINNYEPYIEPEVVFMEHLH